MRKLSRAFVVFAYLLAVSVILSAIVLIVPTASASHSVTVTVARIRCVDEVDIGGGADWFYYIGIANAGGAFSWSGALTATSGCDVRPGGSHTFSPSGQSVDITIYACDDDIIGGDDFADISSDSSGGVDNVVCTPPASGTYGGAYLGRYSVVTGSLTGDTTQSEPDGRRTSGDFDGSTTIDENDADLWFTISDTYTSPSCSASVSPTTGLESTTTFSFSSTVIGGHTPYSYSWAFGDGGTSTSPTPAHNYADAGSYTAQLTVTDGVGIQATCSTSVSVQHAGPISLTVSPASTSVVEGQNVLFTPSVRDVRSHDVTTTATITWSVAPSSCGTFAGNQFSASISSGGQTCTATASASFGTWTDSESATIQVSHGPPSSVQVTPASATLRRGQSVVLAVTVNDAAGHDITSTSSISWTGSPSTLGSVAPATGSSTTFTAGSTVGSGTVTATAGTVTGSSSITISNEQPTAAFAFSPASPTIHDVITFVDTSTDADGTIASWLWDFGDGTTSTIPDPAHRFSANGPHTVTLTVTDSDGASATVSEEVQVVNINPSANFTFSPSQPTTQDIVQFTDDSDDDDGSIASWLWDFGDGTTNTVRNPTHTFASPGTHQVTLTVTDDDGGTHTVTRSVVVGAPPPGGSIGGVPVWSILLVLIVVAVLLAVLFLWRKKRRARPAPETPGVSPPPR